MLAPAIIACKRPGWGQSFHRKRLGQLYCSERCRKADFKRRTGSQRSVALDAPATVLPEKRPPAPAESQHHLQGLLGVISHRPDTRSAARRRLPPRILRGRIPKAASEPRSNVC